MTDEVDSVSALLQSLDLGLTENTSVRGQLDWNTVLSVIFTTHSSLLVGEKYLLVQELCFVCLKIQSLEFQNHPAMLMSHT